MKRTIIIIAAITAMFAFCNTAKTQDLDEIRDIFEHGVANIRKVEKECLEGCVDYAANRERLQRMVADIASSI